jgi:hypothetical protein
MYGSELRTYGLSAVVSVLLGVGIGFGWHYFVDSAGATGVLSAVTPPAQQDAPNPPSSNPAAGREGPVLDVPRFPDSSHAQRPDGHNPRKRCTKGQVCRKYQPRR